MFLFHLLLSSAFGQSSLDKNIEYLRKMVKKGKCSSKISGKVDTYVKKNIDYPLVWKLRAEADSCLKKSNFENKKGPNRNYVSKEVILFVDCFFKTI